MKEPAQHLIDSGSSYIGGGILVLGTPLIDIANVAQAVGLILGVIVISIKLIYDGLKLKRDFFSRGGGDD